MVNGRFMLRLAAELRVLRGVTTTS